jgi:hypothetical protein
VVIRGGWVVVKGFPHIGFGCTTRLEDVVNLFVLMFHDPRK